VGISFGAVRAGQRCGEGGGGSGGQSLGVEMSFSAG
jgi:hypothetical protein